ncbi:M24 family metallopeptidase [Kallotenue papyrolyticum]|uniref:M24 family metallopeptidase n=1 Tax=Kallotenue papyrolyticum TaxID=1325125 RepID=UPI0004785389|nr:Xaa-Pro peptidase family protein [Kallotenue papyrolyticum]
MDEYAIKHARLMHLLRERGLDGVVLARSANIAWISGGKRVYIDTSSEQGIARLLITAERRIVLTNNIEAERLRQEEGFGDWEIVVTPWYAADEASAQLAAGLRLGSDLPQAEMPDLSAELVQLRAPLSEAEIARYRRLGQDAGAALAEVMHRLRPGMREYEIAGLAADAAYRIGAVPVVVLVASDERLMHVRHPLPTERRLERAVMVVLCARRDGLIANLTRLAHVGEPPTELRQRVRAVAEIEARAMLATRPGARFADIFATIREAYRQVGFADEWRNHHQGGPCSYASRDEIVTPASQGRVQAPQAFAWNPSVPGAKSEDTFLVSEQGYEVLTASPDWPMLTIEIEGQRVLRPDLLVL